MKTNSLFMPALTLSALLLPLASGLIDVRVAFIVLFFAALMVRIFLGRQEVTLQCVDTVFYVASLILTLYFVDTAVSGGMFPFFDSLSDKAAFTDMLALWVVLEAVLRYTYSEDTQTDVVCITAGVIAELTLAVNGNWGAQFLMLAIIVGVSACIMPVAEQMKRVLQFFFGAAFLLCNMSLLFGYTDWLQVKNVTYSLETSIVGELALSALALYVLHEWDKIPENMDIKKVRLCSLQRRIRQAAVLVLAATALTLLLGYDMGIGSGTQIAFLGADGQAAQTGIFTNTAVSLQYGAYGALQAALSRSLLETSLAFWGFGGAVLAFLGLAACIWLLYRGYKDSFGGETHFAAIALLEVLQLFLLPSAWELLPMYALFFYGAVGAYLPTKDIVKGFIRHTNG